MRNIIYRYQSAAALLAAGMLGWNTLAAGSFDAPKKFYRDDPVWSMPRPLPVNAVAPRKLNDYYDFFHNTMFAPGEHARNHGEYMPSQGINTVDEVPDSEWYTNRHAMRRMSLEELMAGPGNANAPAPGRWTVVAAKNEGVTPGFRIKDSTGRVYLIKFDPHSNPELASAADVISSKFFYALGYYVPENYIVYFTPGQLVIGDGAQLKDGSGRKRPIRESDISEMLAKAPREHDGSYRAMASRLLAGKPVGPFRYYGTRSDDPNDVIPHEQRRDLRALRTINAWLGHDDSRAINTLDMLVNDHGTPFLKHYLIDFGATLGSASYGANSPRSGNAYLFAWRDSAAQVFSLGLYAPKWQHAKYPDLPSVGRFEYEVFDPERWVPEYPNPAFANENRADRLWAARKIVAFTDEEIRAIVSTGEYSDPAAAEWVARCLIERRNKIVRAFATGTGALDRFEIRGNGLRYQIAGGSAPGALAVQWFGFDNRTTRQWTLPGANSLDIPQPDGAEYVMATITGQSGPATSVYVSLKHDEKRIVGIERSFADGK